MTGTFRSGGPRQDNNSFETPALHVATVGLEGVGDTKSLRPSVIKRAAVVLVHLSKSLKNVARGKDLHLLPRCTLQAGSPFRSCRRFSNEALPVFNSSRLHRQRQPRESRSFLDNHTSFPWFAVFVLGSISCWSTVAETKKGLGPAFVVQVLHKLHQTVFSGMKLCTKRHLKRGPV
jgi:hypothetical protein